MVRVVGFAGSGFVWVWETDACDTGGSVFADLKEPCDLLLDSSVLLRRVY